MRGPAVLKRIEEFPGNAPGTGGLMAFKDSNWLMSIVVPAAPSKRWRPRSAEESRPVQPDFPPPRPRAAAWSGT
ncbi:oleate hydratase [Streptomyces sp. H39-S7]|uniref:oleate hydratase n=1 Tax=Streptomyces sp. H39-S7 TaxID=3004357 RepID=UPI0022B07EAF|nr:oleate hydratase [Streptomyces sp. H39-S7]MCZ4125906.1 oleate hydratase [Streptomyces sp. H39-S7]